MAHFQGASGASHLPSETNNDLEKCGSWLTSIPPDTAIMMQHTREYRDFLAACERLQRAQVKVEAWRGDPMSIEDDAFDFSCMHGQSEFPFLQYATADEIILRVFDFLECSSLVACRSTCTRFQHLADKNASRRVQNIAEERQLSNVMMLLRAREQIEGVGSGVGVGVNGAFAHVRIPTLLLQRRVQVSDAGDPDFNGVYHCTGSNGNGFVFTKPRQPIQRVQQRRSIRSLSEDTAVTRDESEIARPGKALRCIIAKRFSSQTILWYLSKEEVATEDNGEVRAGDVTQTFSFWSKLMVIGDASPDMCRYPSQSSVLERNQNAWQVLPATITMEPPNVELLDES